MEKYRKKKKKKKKKDYTELEKILYYDFILKGKVEKAKKLAADPNCNVNWATWQGVTHLIRASNKGYQDVVKVLLQRQDISVNHQNNFGDSALIYAMKGGRTRCAELLINDTRIDINLVDMHGCSALDYAYSCSHLPTMKLLISHGAANVDGIADSVRRYYTRCVVTPPSTEATIMMKNWKLYLSEFTRFAKTNKYYPTEFKEWAFNFILCCLKSRSFPKDIIYLLLEYIARAWKKI